jgi:hypothetical protein
MIQATVLCCNPRSNRRTRDLAPWVARKERHSRYCRLLGDRLDSGVQAKVPKCQPATRITCSMVPDSGGAVIDLLLYGYGFGRPLPSPPLCFAEKSNLQPRLGKATSPFVLLIRSFPSISPSALLTLIGVAFAGMVEDAPSVDESAGPAVWRCMPPSRAFSIRSRDYSSHCLEYSHSPGLPHSKVAGKDLWGGKERHRLSSASAVTPISTRVFMQTSIFSMALPLFTCILSTFIDSFLPAPLP